MPISRRELRRPAWLHMPRRTARVRLTALYGGLFLISGAALVFVTFLLFERATAFTKPELPRSPAHRRSRILRIFRYKRPLRRWQTTKVKWSIA